MQYRREIDGLRALAVIPVILFHAGLKKFQGGFIGVDVFFVISGYLITTILLSELSAGNFSIINFYERRARRILPALFVVMAACLPFAWLWYFPKEMTSFFHSLMAVPVFSSNILFLHESSYFGVQAELKPLLHTWSLAVEEQFYVIFPLVLLLSWRMNRRWIMPALMAIALLSLAAAQWGAYHMPEETFYLLPTRSWELAIGAIIACYLFQNKRVVLGQLATQALAMCGLLAIVCSILVFNKSTPFPSLYALLPTLGTGLIILFATPGTLVGQLLARRELVGIGLLSYSAYLWHQPIFAFARYRAEAPISNAWMLLLSLGAFILAYATWLWVEKPIRNNKKIRRKHVFVAAGIGSLFFFCIGAVGSFTDVLVSRKSQAQEIDARMRYNTGLSRNCLQFADTPECRTSTAPEVVVWGDSYSMHLVNGLMASKRDLKIFQSTLGGCAPIIGVAKTAPHISEAAAMKCIQQNDVTLAWLKTQKSVKYVVLSSPFSEFSDLTLMVMNADGKLVKGYGLAFEQFVKTLDTIKSLSMTPVVFSPPPWNGKDIGKCLVNAHYLQRGHVDECDFDSAISMGRQQSILDALNQLKTNGYNVVFLSDGICANDRCHASIGDTFIYNDGNGHLSVEGSALLGERMDFYKLLSE